MALKGGETIHYMLILVYLFLREEHTLSLQITHYSHFKGIWKASQLIISIYIEMYVYDFNSHTREGVTPPEQSCISAEYFNSHTREGVTEDNYVCYKRL